MTDTDATARPGSAVDVIDLLTQQHNEVKALFSQIESATGDDKEAAFCELRRLLAVHETAEEEVVYPVLRTAGDDGSRIADERIVEESEAKDMLADLEDTPCDDQRFDAQIRIFRDAVIDHAEAEEQEVFPLLRSTQTGDRLETMGTLVRTAEAAAPTHPHPHGPDSATGNLVVGPFVAIADRVRDALRS